MKMGPIMYRLEPTMADVKPLTINSTSDKRTAYNKEVARRKKLLKQPWDGFTSREACEKARLKQDDPTAWRINEYSHLYF